MRMEVRDMKGMVFVFINHLLLICDVALVTKFEFISNQAFCRVKALLKSELASSFPSQLLFSFPFISPYQIIKTSGNRGNGK